MPFKPIANGARAHTLKRSTRAFAVLVAAVAGAAMASLAGLADAQSPAAVATASNSTLGETIVVDSHGVTVYELRPETATHILCTKANGCFSVWRPLTAASAKAKLRAGRGVPGKLGIAHHNGIFQITLAGHPLYHFAGDGSRKGAAGGQGIHSFGGTWHVIATSTASTNPVMTTTTPTTTTPTTPTMTTTTPTTPTVPYYPPIPLY
jgi:predicted lipoprotein with Yx(FWY)xxD motif